MTAAPKHSHAGITIQQCWRLDNLLPVPAPLAFECVVGLAERVFFEQEQLPEVVTRKMTLRILLLIHHA